MQFKSKVIILYQTLGGEDIYLNVEKQGSNRLADNVLEALSLMIA